ncbi:MAG TPA: nucleoside triphosphate pyrophosphohydrolase [Syntrophothermus lipocalidus]|uniref:MazG family protein n=1 Tax=Syntrophothermus lipocalidus (strain DSM 12680 / TGB-C1) TaxID=643648 RepID=D7CIP6_SYNLT|nr:MULTISPECIES: nucleoside triphosphate pyrophosphohydrolase [Syntrophothermus]ADI00911.1 MazG family protein [Syntrophothermus lipocalidus DSM 12680]NSW84158.1 nucleoside triphosphate pyrophosphohydrolase [Syntrophothermus sp.]HHV77241.1 nucleoside triphosphate pyrophosphohydrolase [Syntrophothermus lipocalidus]
MDKYPLDELVEVMDRLLGPGGCPWDREQTHASLTRYLIEEAYEVVDAIWQKDMDKLKEELGDVLLQVVFHSALARREEAFDINDVIKGVTEKMINRHPHVFGSMNLSTSSEVLDRWEGFKEKEGKKRVLEGIPKSLPALMRAEKLQSKAARVGFDWPDVEGALQKVAEEVRELAEAKEPENVAAEMGDILFAVVNVARFLGVDPEEALQKTNNKFEDRFRYIEDNLVQQGKAWSEVSLEEMDALWEEAKAKF